MGLVNLLPGRVVRVAPGEGLISVAGSEPVPVSLGTRVEAGEEVQVAIRPESLRLVPDGAGPEAAGVLRGKVAELTYLGNLVDCHLVLADGTRVRVQADPEVSLQIGQSLRVAFEPRACTVFEA
jgi:ABC-type Fe3+/spermidine/putrescine transport system ATPase subunit